MDVIPPRPQVAGFYRSVLTRLEAMITLPDINVACYHAAGIALSVLVYAVNAPLLKALLIALVLVADWLDGATARRFKRTSRSGYFTDLLTDRASEAFIFAAGSATVVGKVFFILWIINTLLSFYSAKVNRHLSLPLRFVYMLIMLAQPIFPQLMA